MKKAFYITPLTLAVMAVAAVFGFQREYVVSPDGLLDLSARRRGQGVVVVSGAIMSSGAKITKTTVARSDNVVLVRV